MAATTQMGAPRTMVRIGRVTPGTPMSMELGQMLVNDLAKHERVVCDGFPAAPEHLRWIPPGSSIVLVFCDEAMREERLNQRALDTRLDTSRAWTPGMPSERDGWVGNVFSAARGLPLTLSVFDNSGPMPSGLEILSRLVQIS